MHPPEPIYPCYLPVLGEFNRMTPHEGPSTSLPELGYWFESAQRAVENARRRVLGGGFRRDLRQVVRRVLQPEISLERCDSPGFHICGDRHADVPEMPRLIFVACDALRPRRVPDDEPVFPTVRGRETPNGSVGEASLQGTNAARVADVHGQAGLVFAVTGACSQGIGGLLAVLGDIVVIKILLLGVGAVSAGGPDVDP